MSEWIDINERLPKERQQVLIAHREGGVMQADYQDIWIKTIGPNGGRKQRFLTPYGDETYDINDPHPQITHWMPLPISPTMNNKSDKGFYQPVAIAGRLIPPGAK